jgi:transposase-like protein
MAFFLFTVAVSTCSGCHFFISMVSQRSYTIAKKREVIEIAMTSGVRPTARKFGIPRATVRDWVLNQEKPFAFSGSKKKKATQG